VTERNESPAALGTLATGFLVTGGGLLTAGVTQDRAVLTFGGSLLLIVAVYFGYRLVKPPSTKPAQQPSIRVRIPAPSSAPVAAPVVPRREYIGMTAQVLLQRFHERQQDELWIRVSSAFREQYEGKWVVAESIVNSIETDALVLERGLIRARFSRGTRGLQVHPGERVLVHGTYAGFFPLKTSGPFLLTLDNCELKSEGSTRF
jgi:hypothetical protein